MLIVDTLFSGLGCRFDEVFDFKGLPIDWQIYDDRVANQLAAVSVFPQAVAGRLNSYETTTKSGVLGVFEASSLTPLGLDFRKSYSETVVLHHGGGGGQMSKHLFPYLDFSASVKPRIRKKLEGLPPRYSAIHVRNSDYSTAYQEVFSAVLSGLFRNPTPIIVCSDDPMVVQEARKVFGSFLSDYTVPRPMVSGPLHKQDSVTDAVRQQINFATLVEIMTLSCADVFFYSKTNGRRGSPKSPISGFSLMVRNLRRAQTPLNASVPVSVGLQSKRRVSIRIFSFRAEIQAITKFWRFWLLKFRAAVGRLIYSTFS